MMKILFSIIILITILICLIYINYFYYKETFNTINDNNLDFLKNKEVDIVCSGPSSKNIKLKTNIVICPNSAILNKQIINNKNITLIWIIEHKFYSDQSYQKKIDTILSKLNRDIDYLYMKIWPKKLEAIEKFKKRISDKSPNIIIQELDFSKQKYNFPSKYIKKNLFISSGIECINFGISKNVKKMYISGIETGESSDYKYNSEIGISPRVNKPIHNNEDIKYINSLSNDDLSKLVPVEKSGLYKYLKENRQNYKNIENFENKDNKSICLDKVENLIKKIKIFKNNSNYRFNDIINHQGRRGPSVITKEILNDKKYNNTILQEYIKRCPDNNLGRSTYKNYKKLTHTVMNEYIKKNNIVLPSNDELVIHLRLGDVIEHKRRGPKLLKKDFVYIINNYINKYKIKKCTFVTAFNYAGNQGKDIKHNLWLYTENKQNKNNLLLKNFLLNLCEKVNIEIDVKSSKNVDEDFIYMMKAKYFEYDLELGFSKFILDLRNFKN